MDECSPILYIPEEGSFYESLTYFAQVCGTIFINLCVFVGPINVIVNIFVMIILASKQLRSAYNLVFFLMALDQTIVIGLVTITMYRRFVFAQCTPWNFSLFWAIFDLVRQHLTIVLIAHATWLAVIIALMRIVSMRSQGTKEINFKVAAILCGSSMIFILLAHAPNYVTVLIVWIPFKYACQTEEDIIIPLAMESPDVYLNNCLLLRVSSLGTGFLHNALPSLILLVLLPSLMIFLQKARKERDQLRRASVRQSTEKDRTTTLLILILISSMVSGIPYAFVYLLEGLLSSKMRNEVTSKITTLVFLFIIVTSACNLFIYLFMSKKFREVAKSYVCFPYRKIRNIATSQASSQVHMLTRFLIKTSWVKFLTIMVDVIPACSSILSVPEDSPLYDFLIDFSVLNKNIFIKLCVFLGPINIIANIFVMIILSSKELRNAYNLVFFLMALEQTIVIGVLTIMMFRGYVFFQCTPWNFSLYWAIFELVCQHLMLVCIAHATWLAVIIALMRIVSIRSHGTKEIKLKHTSILCGSSMIFVIVANIPNFFVYTIVWKRLKDICTSGEFGEVMIPMMTESSAVYMNDCLLLRINSLVTGFLHNFLPFIFLLILLPTLLIILRNVRRERDEIRHTSVTDHNDGDRTTTLLILIMISTMVSEIPQAIIYLLEGLLSSKMRTRVTSKISTLVMSFIIISSACNLFIYLSMSKKFREVAKSYVCFPYRKFRKIASSKGSSSS